MNKEIPQSDRTKETRTKVDSYDDPSPTIRNYHVQDHHQDLDQTTPLHDLVRIEKGEKER